MPLFSWGSNQGDVALALLRNKPETALKSFGFLVETDSVKTFNKAHGGNCKVSCKQADGQVYQIVVSQGGTDWFFPYRAAGTGGVGCCIVPIGQSNGTLVLTGGMNGCSLQVNRAAGVFYFYHDANGTSLAKNGSPIGKIVCRIDYKDYAGPLELGLKGAISYTQKGVNTYFGHSLITVRESGKWKVYVSGVHTFGNKGKYAVFRPTITPCITSFDDS